MAHLQNGALNVSALREKARADLIYALDALKGKKMLVLDPTLSGPLGLIIEKAVLKEHGVERICHLSSDRLDCGEFNKIMYIVRPKVQYMKNIAFQIKAESRAAVSREVHVLVVPRQTMVCRRILEEEGVLGNIALDEFRLDLFPFEEDVLSLEMSDAARECFVHGDRTSLMHVARAIVNLQASFGLIPLFRGKGNAARAVCDMVLRMRRDIPPEDIPRESEISMCIIVDREVDLVTPMLTQLTYEGLVDELFGISNGMVDLDPSIVGPPPQAQPGQPVPKKIKVALNGADRVFSDLRDLNFTAVGPVLKRRALQLQEIQQERHQVGGEVRAIADYVKKLKEMNVQQEKAMLALHTNLASNIGGVVREGGFSRRLEAEQCVLQGRDGRVNDEIEESMYRGDPLMKTLRLMCLLSVTNNGLKKYAEYKKELLQTYGYDVLFTLNNLEKIGLFKKQEGRAAFSTLKKSLNLLVEDVDEINPRDISYVYSGYAPLSARIVQNALRPPVAGFRSLDETLKSLPGPLFEENVPTAAAASSAAQGGGGVMMPTLPTAQTSSSAGSKGKVVLVVYVGGVTFTELAATRFLEKQEEGQRSVVVLTTKLINGDSFLDSLADKMPTAMSAAPRRK